MPTRLLVVAAENWIEGSGVDSWQMREELSAVQYN
jgi:hypothetical protein